LGSAEARMTRERAGRTEKERAGRARLLRWATARVLVCAAASAMLVRSCQEGERNGLLFLTVRFGALWCRSNIPEISGP
jgi:hypothetical protein